MTRLMNL